MIDFTNIEKYKENNRIEAKKALGGLPHSIWETYSAFANTMGGIILLGVEEHRDKTLHTVDLPDPRRLIREFWELLNDPKKASVNILSEKDVTVEEADGNRIIAIRVPRAQRYDKPVYVDGNPFLGSYRRSGEGDYKCTKEEVEGMLRDAAVKTQDMKVLEHLGTDALDYGSVRRYRYQLNTHRPDYIPKELSDLEFLCRLRAVDKGTDGVMHPTAAGLLMFGLAVAIEKEYPHYSLDYQEWMTSEACPSYSIQSVSGDWSGNVYDFYLRVCDRMALGMHDLRTDEKTETSREPSVPMALREALANCLINADYYGRQGIMIQKKKDWITLSNPGGFRIDVEAAKSGGISDPRNGALIKMFHLIGVGSGSGSGIPGIFSVWKKQGWRAPEIIETFEPDRITLSLAMGGNSDSDTASTRRGKGITLQTIAYRQAIVNYLTENVSAKSAELGELLGVKPSRVRAILSRMMADGIIAAEGDKRNRRYKLRA